MFTGLIEATGVVEELKPTPSGFSLWLTTGLSAELTAGDSLAVNGVCLTVVVADADGVHADISPETARVTAIVALRRGALVNLERPLRADARLGGHFVQGHVDSTGTIEEIRREGDSYWVTVVFPPSLAPYIVRKGSITVNGISLTVAGVDDRRFDVQIIPYTWEHTNLHLAKQGDIVNIECDILGKYVVRVAELAGMTSHLNTTPKTTH
ncbi:MAG: riboflavin synthase [Acidobacteriota bacterium]